MFQLAYLGIDIDHVDDVSYDLVHELVVLTVRLSDAEQGSGTRTRQTKGSMAYLRTDTSSCRTRPAPLDVNE